MSYFAIITFDLNYPGMSPHGNGVYKKITDRLEQLDFYKARHGRQKSPFDLPSNTYVAEFDEDDYEKAKDLAQEVSDNLRDIFDDLGANGKFFVFVGSKWAWKGGEV